MNKGFRILVVDDDSRFLGTSSHLLKSAGYEVIEATTGCDGLRLAKERGPDLLLVGVSLPDMDGFEMCRRVKADVTLADSYVALLSGTRARSGGQVEGVETGADGYIMRPISNREFLARVRAMVYMRQAEDVLRERMHELDERAKELNCLYGISALLKKPGVSLTEILQGTTDLIPPAWQYPEVTGARIVLEGQEFGTKNFVENSPWRQTVDIVVHGQCSGAVEVCYVEKRPECDEGPFLREERELLNAIAERLGRIVERVRAEEALVRERNLLRTLIDSLPDYIYVKDTADRFVVGNVALGCHMGATTPDELVGETDFDFFPRELATQYYADEQEIIRSGQPLINQEELAVDKAMGDKRWHLTTKVPVRDSCGKVVGIVGITRDITERKRTEEELLRSREETLRNHRLLLALSQAAQTVQRARTSEEVYRTIGDEVTGLGYHAMVFTLADDREHVTLSHATFGPAWLRTVEELSGLVVLGFRFPLVPDGLFQRVIAGGESVFCEQTAELVAKGVPKLGRPLIERLVAMLGIEKSIYTPLKVGGETHGLLGVASTGLAESDVPAVALFANQAGIAIENAQLLEQVGTSREQLRQLAQQIVSDQEEERRRWSRALHDEAGQALTALKVSLELIEADLPVEFDSLRRRISDAAVLATTTMEQIRLLAQDLHPPALDAVGLNPALESYCRDFAERTGLSIDYLGLELPALPEAFNTCLYRFLQEALTNVVKHARAYHVRIALRHDAETVNLSVEDDGQGFDRQVWLSVSGWPMGIGLLGMQERLESLGGRLEIASRPGQGTRLVAHLPVGGIP